jgi:hypothetical protein
MKEIGGVILDAYGLDNRKVRLLFDPKNTFYGKKMVDFSDRQPSSEVTELVDNLTEGERLHLTGTVVDKEEGELLLIPNVVNHVKVKMLEY